MRSYNVVISVHTFCVCLRGFFSETSFYAKFEFFAKPQSIKVYTHGQYEKCGVGGTYGAAKHGGDDRAIMIATYASLVAIGTQ